MSRKQELAALKIERVERWSHEELVKLVLTQQKLIEKLQAELKKLKERQPSNSKTSWKPPSSDLISKSEKASSEKSQESESQPKPKPGGQPGHIGKTRKGSGPVDRYEISVPYQCEHCGSRELSEIFSNSKQQLACLALFCHFRQKIIWDGYSIRPLPKTLISAILLENKCSNPYSIYS
jgi:transposase